MTYNVIQFCSYYYVFIRIKNGNNVLETHNNSDHTITYDSDSDYFRVQAGFLRCVFHSLELLHPNVFHLCFFCRK